MSRKARASAAYCSSSAAVHELWRARDVVPGHENGRVRVVANGEARAVQKREREGMAMARPWSTFARSPMIGAGAPEHGRGYGEATASVETLWGVCGERGVSGGEVWCQGGARVAFYRRAAGHRGQGAREVQGMNGHAIGASGRCGNVGELR